MRKRVRAAPKKRMQFEARKKHDWLPIVISEVAIFAFLFYAQYLIGVDMKGVNLWSSSFILWALLNIAVLTCCHAKCCK